MGTRNLTKVIDENGITRVAQYGQWDGYPSYSGVRMLNFISEYGMLDKIKTSLIKCRFATQQELDAIYDAFNDSPKYDEIRDGIGSFSTIFPSLTRDTGVDILKVIVYSNDEVLLSNQEDFENDDLFCEGVYTLDFKQRLFISKFNGATLIHEFDRLPSEDEYLNAWKHLTPTP